MNIKLEQMRVFVTVAEQGTIGEAASILGRTPAAVSMTLSQIENQLNGPIFDGERKSSLTPLGKHCYQRFSRAVAEHQQAISDIRKYSSGDSGESRIAVVPSVAIWLLPAAVNRLSLSLPNLRLDIRDIDSSAIHQAVLSGSVNFGIASRPNDASIDCEYLLADSYQIICRADDPLVSINRPLKWSDIDGERFIFNGLCRQIEHPAIRQLATESKLSIHNTLSIFTFIEDGFGITLLPTLNQPVNSELRALAMPKLSNRRELFILRRHGVSLSPLDNRLIEAIRQQAKLMGFFVDE